MTETATKTPPPPVFDHHAYGVSLTWIGDDGGMFAEGHVPERRFVAACNHLARTQARLRNLADDRAVSLDEVLVSVRHCWALPVDGRGGWDWCVRHDSRVTADTPGAIPVTMYSPDWP